MDPDILLAVGQANGKVALTTFGPTTFDSLGLAGRELGNLFVIVIFHCAVFHRKFENNPVLFSA